MRWNKIKRFCYSLLCLTFLFSVFSCRNEKPSPVEPTGISTAEIEKLLEGGRWKVIKYRQIINGRDTMFAYGTYATPDTNRKDSNWIYTFTGKRAQPNSRFLSIPPSDSGFLRGNRYSSTGVFMSGSRTIGNGFTYTLEGNRITIYGGVQEQLPISYSGKDSVYPWDSLRNSVYLIFHNDTTLYLNERPTFDLPYLYHLAKYPIAELRKRPR